MIFFSKLTSQSSAKPVVEHSSLHLYGVLCLLISFCVSIAVFGASTQDKQWFFAVSLVFIAGYSCLIFQKYLRPILLAATVSLIPLRIDFYLLYKPTGFIATSYPGLPVTLFDLMLLTLIGYWLFQVLKGEQKIKIFPSISIPFLIYIILTGISACWSADLALSFSLWALVIKSYVAFLFFANQIKNEQDVKIVIIGLCAGVLLQSFVGLLQYTGIESFAGLFGMPETGVKESFQGRYILSRVTGTLGHPNTLAKYLALCIPAIFIFACMKLRSLPGKLALLGAVAGGLTLLLTMSRGSWVGMGFAMAFVFFELLKRYFNSRLKSFILLSLILGVSFIGTISIFEDVRVRLFEDDYRSAQSRIPMAKIALNIIEENPVRGVGLNNYTRVMKQYDRTREWQSVIFPHPVHNSYLLITAESGIQTLLVFLWLITAAIRLGRPAFDFSGSSLSLLQIGWIASLSTWLIAGLFDRDYAGSSIMLWFIVAMIAATSQMSFSKQAQTVKPNNRINRVSIKAVRDYGGSKSIR